MRRSLVSAFCLAALAILGACSDETRTGAGLPSEPLLAKGGPNAQTVCTQQAANGIEQDIRGLYGSPAAAANSLFDAVQAACSATNADAARDPLMDYLAYTIANPVTGQNSLMLAHWGRVFAFVGYTGVDVGAAPNISEAVFGPQGATAVVDLGGGDDVVLTRDNVAGIEVPGQTGGLSGKRLVTIEPASGPCLGTNLQQTNACQFFGIFPQTAPFSPKLHFAICETTGLPANAALGHQPHNQPVNVLARTTPDFCPPHTSDNSGFFGRDLGRFGQVLASVADLFRPRVAIAGHTGLGGQDFSASPVNPLNAETFAANFNNDVVGQPPSAPDFPANAWTANAPPPGSILVQASIGGPNGLTDQPVVMNQAGGACRNCGTLELSAAMFNSGLGFSADEGVYEVRFKALQARPSVKEAPFLLRDGAGREIARLSYRSVSNESRLYFNGSPTGCFWTTGVAQDFTITVDFDNDQTWVAIGGCGSTAPEDFANKNAASLVRLGWVMSGIDAGIVGWDDIQVIRLADVIGS